MTEVRGARRAAEKAARERLAGPLINAAGELGVAVAGQQAASDGITAAEERAREHVQQAQQEADKILAEARAQVTSADDGYRQAHEQAVLAGWSPAALGEMGYPAPSPVRRSRGQAARVELTHQADEAVSTEPTEAMRVA